MNKKTAKIISPSKLEENCLAENFFNLANVIFIVIDKNGIIQKINKKGVSILGGDDEKKIIGRNWVKDFIPDNFKPKIKSVIKKISLNSHDFEYFENPIKTLQGSIKIIAWNNSIIKDQKGNIKYILSSGQDITNRRIAEEHLAKTNENLEKMVAERTMELTKEFKEKNRALKALEENEEKYRKLVNNANEFVLIFDKDGFVEFANDSFLKFSRRKNIIFKKIHYSRFVENEELAGINSKFLSILKNKTSIASGEFKAKDDKNRPIYINYSATTVADSKGEISGVQVIARDITVEKLLTKEVEKSKEHYEQIINTIQDGICVIDKNFKILSYNKAFFDNLDIKKNKKITGKDYKKIVEKYKKGAIRNFCCPKCEDRSCVLDKIFTTGKPINIEKKDVDFNGKAYYHRVTFLPSINNEGGVDKLVISIRDITKKRMAIEEVQRLHQFNQKILDNAPVSILVLDRNGLIISANSLAAKLMNKNYKDILGRKLAETSTIRDNKEILLKYKILLKEGKPLYSENLEYKAENDSSLKFLNLLAVPLFDQNNKIEGAISMGIDNSEAMQARLNLYKLNEKLEQKVIERTEELNRINKRLGIMLDLKSKFVADASHELRTPLTVIQGNLDLAIREAEYNNIPIPEIYEILMYEVSRMRNILTDLTILTNVDSESEQLCYETVYINDIVKAVAQSMDVLAKQKNILLICQKGLKNISLKGDEAKLEKLLLNLVRNAIKYTNEGGKVKINVKKEEDHLNISVEDTGIGIPEDEIDYIFERFYRVDQSRNSSEGGTGLGLSIAKWIAEAHGGSVKAISRLGVGSKFIITLPLNKRQKSDEIKKQTWFVKQHINN